MKSTIKEIRTLQPREQQAKWNLDSNINDLLVCLILFLVFVLQDSVSQYICIPMLFVLASLFSLIHINLVSAAFTFKEVAVTLSDYRIRQIATYTFILSRFQYSNFSQTPWDQEIVNTNATIVIQFPNQYSPNLIAQAQAISLTIYNRSGVLRPTPVLTVQNNNLVLSNFLSTPDYISNATLNFSNIQNPIPALKTSSFIAILGNDISSAGTSFSLVQLTPGSLAPCSATFSNGLVNRVDSLRISFTSLTALSADSIVKVTFPQYYARDHQQQSVGVLSTMSCTTTFQTYGIYCDGTTNNYTVNVFNSIIIGGSTAAQFSIDRILVPPSTETVDTITVRTFSNAMIPFDSCVVTFSNLQPVQLSGLSMTSNSSLMVNSQRSINFSIPTYNPIYSSDSVVVTLSTSYLPVYQLLSLTGSSSNQAKSVVFTLNSNSLNTINISSNVNISTGQYLFVNINRIFAPPAAGIELASSVSVYQSGYVKATGTLPIYSLPNIITDLRTTAASTIVSTATTYTITYTTPDPLTPNSMIILTIPSAISIPNTLTTATVNANSIVYSIKSNNIINLTLLPSIPAGSTVTISLARLTNPASTDALQNNLTLYSYYSIDLNQLMYYGNYLPSEVVYTPGTTITFTVQSSSQVVNAKNTSWTLTVSTTTAVPQGGRIDVEIYQASYFQWPSNITNISCSLLTGIQVIHTLCLLVTVNRTAGTYRVEVSNIASALPLQFNLTIMQAMPNPDSTQPIVYLTMATYSQSGSPVQLSDPAQGVYLTISEPQPLIVFQVSRGSKKNSQASNYTFYALQESTFRRSLSSANSAMIVLPVQLNLTSAYCQFCTIYLSNHTVIFELAVTPGQNSLNLTIFNIINAYSFEPTQTNIALKTILNGVYNYSFSHRPNNYLQLVNVFPAELALLTASTHYSNFQYGEDNTLIITANVTNSKAKDYLVIIDPEFIVGNISCTVSAFYQCSFNSTNKVVELMPINSSVIATGLIEIKISGFSNPNNPAVASAQCFMEGYSASDYLVNSYTGNTLLVWKPVCIFPCRTCSPGNQSSCLSCYLDRNVTLLNYLSNQQCRSSCFSTQILQANICIPCTSNCLQCSITSGNCTACDTTSLYSYFFNSTCLQAHQCPTFYFASLSYQCLPCPQPCLTCNATSCITCISTTYKYLEQCFSTCPANITVNEPTNMTCLPCSPTCATCSMSVDNCTSCPPGTILSNSTCQSQCSASYYIKGESCVDSCQFPCSTCLIFADHCISCQGFLFQLQGKCLPTCPTFYYSNNSAMQCQNCNLLGMNCYNCQNNYNCSLFGGPINCQPDQHYSCLNCNPNYTNYYNPIKQIYQCIIVVPDGYTAVNGRAQLCIDPCLTCQNLVNNCTLCMTLKYHQGKCLSVCPDFYYSDSITVNLSLGNLSTLTCRLCVSPCRTCTGLTTCLSCQNNTYYDGNFSCVNASQCPTFTYPNNSLSMCVDCIQPCLSCSSFYSCFSCVNDTYLYNTSCLASCPKGYFQNITSNQCSRCHSPCLGCYLGQSVCLSCVSGTYYYSYNFTCLAQCPVGFYPDNEAQLCLNCTAPCLQCDLSSCLRCAGTYLNISYYLHQGICRPSCPDGSYAKSDLANPMCDLCDVSCLTCSGNSYNCTLCNATGDYKALANDSSICVETCPQNMPVLRVTMDQLICYDCSDQLCLTCNFTDKCLVCLNSTLVLIAGKCFIDCPQGQVKKFDSISNISFCTTNNSTANDSILIESEGITFTLPFYFPCSIAAGALCCIAIMLKAYQHCVKNNANAQLMALMSAALSIPEFVAMSLSAFSYFLLRYKVFVKGPLEWDPFIYVYCLCLLLSLLTGIYVMVLATRTLWLDKVYQKWHRCANCLQKLYQYCINVLTLLNFKAIHALFCGIKSLPLLQSPAKLAILNKPSGFSILIGLAFTVVSVLNLSYHPQLRMIYLDSIIVVGTSALLALLALRKPHDFFIHHLDQEQVQKHPVNKRVASCDDYLIISGMSPLKDYQDDFYSKMKKNRKSSNADDGLLSEQSSSSRYSQQSSSLLVQSKTPSVHLQNLSLQCTVMEDSSERSRFQRHSEQESVVCMPGGKSSYSGILWDSNGEDRSEKQGQSNVEEQMHPTNLGMLQQGDNVSVSASEGGPDTRAKFILPLQFRRYAVQQQAALNYSYQMQKRKGSQSNVTGKEVRQSQQAKIIENSGRKVSRDSIRVVDIDYSHQLDSSLRSLPTPNKLHPQQLPYLPQQALGRSPSASASVNSDDPQESRTDAALEAHQNILHETILVNSNEDKVSELEPILQIKPQRQKEQSQAINFNYSSQYGLQGPNAYIFEEPVANTKKNLSLEAEKAQVLSHLGLQSGSVGRSNISMATASIERQHAIQQYSQGLPSFVQPQIYPVSKGRFPPQAIQHLENVTENSLQSRKQLKPSVALQREERDWKQQEEQGQEEEEEEDQLDYMNVSDQSGWSHEIDDQNKVGQTSGREKEEADDPNIHQHKSKEKFKLDEEWSNNPNMLQASSASKQSSKVSINKKKGEAHPSLVFSRASSASHNQRLVESVRGKNELHQVSDGNNSSSEPQHLPSNVFDQSLRGSSLLKSSLVKSKHSATNLKSSIKIQGLVGRQDSHHIIDQEAQSIDLEYIEGSQQLDQQQRQKLHQMNKIRASQEGNEFRIKTTRKKKKKGHKEPKEIVLYVNDQKFKILRKEARMISKQTRVNQRIQKTIKQETEEIYRPHMFSPPKGEQRKTSLKKVESVYLTPPKPAKY